MLKANTFGPSGCWLDMNRTLLTALFIVLAAISSGCDREAIAARNADVDRVHAVKWSAEDCGEELVVPHAFTMGWTRFNHRLSRWGIGLDAEACTARHVEVTHVGGVFSKNPFVDDTPTVEFSYQRVRIADDLAFARVTVDDVINADGVVDGEVRFAASEIGLDGFERYTALIEGVHYDTGIEQLDEYPSLYNPSRGYTTRGIGAGVDVRREGDELVLSYSAMFMPGRTPERLFMNWAIPYARIGAGIEAIIVASNGVPVSRGSVDFVVEHDRPPLLEDVRLPAAAEEMRTVSIAGRPSEPRGFWGLQKFSFDLDFDDACEEDDDCSVGSCDEGHCNIGIGKLGEYIREFSVGVRMKDFDPVTGRGRFLVDGYTSNASSFISYYPLRYEFGGQFAWVQAAGESSEHELASDFETGSTRFALP